MGRGELRIGTSGYVYPHWRGIYYPPELRQSDWFEHYARDFDTVEINNTFYHLPDVEVFRRWGEEAPAGFRYAFKASRYLTHLKKLKDPAEPLANFLERARAAGANLGPLLYQLPPRWRVNPERLADFLELLPRDLLHVIELRDPSWYIPAVRELLTAAGVAFCIHDFPGDTPCPEWITGPAVYLRRHGPGETAYAGRYPRADLQRLTPRIAGWLTGGRDVYVYFNNDDRGYAVANALELKGLCRE